MAKVTLGDCGGTALSHEDPFDLYTDWRAEEELSAARRATLRWVAAATVVVVMLSSYGLMQALPGG
jgi:hypothetical protein